MFWTPDIPAMPRPRPVPTVCRAIRSQSPSTMYYVRALFKPTTQRTHLARRRRYDHYFTCFGCHGRYPILARDVRRCRGIDLGRAVALAVVCGLGGGLLRDMTLQVGNVYILNQPMALPLSIATAAIIYIFPAIVDKPDKLIPLLDIISVGIYAATGADKALVYGFAPAVCIMMGFFTAVGGGMLRDGFMGVVPGIFQRTNFYAIAAIAGSASYVSLVMSGLMSNVAALVVCVIVTMGLRWLSLRFDIKSPTEDDIARFLHRKK